MVDIKKLKVLTENLSVLYVEDDFSIQEKMARYLKKFFYLVDIASDGVQGLEFFKKNKYNIVITDLSMPKFNGIDMIKAIKEIDETQHILITTAHSESSYLMDAVKSHVDGYILKPFDYNELNLELFKLSDKIKKYKENEKYKEHLQDMLNTQTKEMQENYEKTIYSMVELIEQRDTYTAGHSKRVAKYCVLIAKEMGYSDDECTLIHQAAILHDIGKIETPDSVLLNPNTLNELEYKLIQEHVNVGYKLLKNIPMFKDFANIVNSHHERYDGSGYPNGLKGDEIGKLSRIIIVADAFDAMTTNRIYKGRRSVKEAINELVELSSKQFHPEVVESAKIALKNVKIDESISQLPKSKLEEERFAYFYSDTLSQAYNQSYLDVVLMKNSYEPNFKYMVVFSINKFSKYNKKYGWEEGDKLLKEVANTLATHFNESLVFRVFGDDFVVISEEEIVTTGVQKVLDSIMEEHKLNYKVSYINLTTKKIEKLTDIEMIQAQKNS